MRSLRKALLAACLFLTPAAAIAALPATSFAAPVAPAPQGLLPDVATPLAYRLDLTILPDQERFSGHTEIDIDLKDAASYLYMHGRDLKISHAVAKVGGRTIAATFTQVDPLGVARLDFQSKLPKGKATLIFDYDAPFQNGPAGLYHIKVGDDWYAWTQFESIDARDAYPSFDQPGYKTPFTVSLTTKPGYVAASNAPETGQVQVGDLVKHTFEQTKPLPTYLVAFVVGPFVTKTGVVPPSPERSYPLPLRVIATKPNADKLDYVINETPSIVQHLEAYFGMPFPFPKLDQIASPVMPGAMENAGADVYGDDIILLDKGAPTTQKQVFGMVVAHELSHQWFGDYVTPAWWSDIWLNESFANWMGYRIGNEWRPELNIGVGAIDEAFGVMDTDALKVGRPIHQPITSNSQIDAAFDGVTYGKGGQVVAMIAAYLGDEKFKEGVRLHMSRHPYGNADSEQFFGALADAAKDPRVLTAMKSFVDQQGFPTVAISHDGDKLVATQARYARLGTQLDPQMWTIPLCVRHGVSRTCTLVDQASQTIDAPGDGVIMPNAGGTGYYRFTLDPKDWDALIASGASLSAGEGLAADDSLWGQFYAGKGDAAQLIEAARVFVNNKDSNVAVDGGDKLSDLRHRGVIGDDAKADYQRVMEEIYQPRLAAMGFDPKAGLYLSEDPDRQKLRQELVTLVATEAKDSALLHQLDVAATAYLAGNKDALDQAFVNRALAVHVQTHGLAAAKDMYERMLNADTEDFRSAARGAVTAGATPETADWLLGALDDKRLRSSEKLALIGGLMRSPQTRDMTFDWVKAHFDDLTAGAGIFTAGRVAALPSGYCSAERADEIDRVMRAKVEAAGRGTLSFDRMLEDIRDCGALKSAESANLAAALKSAK
ncbi:MAG: M1 family aminopeptidase [Asticcacaulis sp.]|uniref:M1 family metallopeptidase n=1 Tax=Asticcacaulis sp. TaxID=1872648 RepID=UPI003F7BEBD9